MVLKIFEIPDLQGNDAFGVIPVLTNNQLFNLTDVCIHKRSSYRFYLQPDGGLEN
jgi:hypothetical protein